MSGKIAVPGGTQGIAVSPDGKRVVVMASAEPTALVIDPATDTIVDRIALAESEGRRLQGLLQPGRQTAADDEPRVGGRSTSSTPPICTACSTRSSVGKDPMGFAFSADGKTALVANHGDGSVSVIDLEKGG